MSLLKFLVPSYNLLSKSKIILGEDLLMAASDIL